MIHNKAPMNYTLNTGSNKAKDSEKQSVWAAVKKLIPLMHGEKKNLIIAFSAIFSSSILNLASPILIGYAIDHYIQTKDYHGVLVMSLILLLIYTTGLVASYIQTKVMGGVGQRILFNLRNAVFNKLQELPVAFFNENKAGDLISRINNDTDKLNQFFSQALVQFIGNTFIIIGAAIFILSINLRLGASALVPAIGLLVFTLAISSYVKRVNLESLQSTGGMSAEISESINNFKVIVAFNRRDYFRDKFQESNNKNYAASVRAGIVNTIFLTPLYGFVANMAQLITLTYGIYLISIGDFTLGLLIGFLTYISRFYDPLRQIASLWSQFQVALAGLDRISEILALQNNLTIVPVMHTETKKDPILEFKDVHFGYPNSEEILHNVSFSLEHGKTYALVGPTGGGKTTTASLMARLYDPTQGIVSLLGRDIRSFESSERAQKIGFILQEPFLFSGTVRDNILYGNEAHTKLSNDELVEVLKQADLDNLISRFEKGLETPVTGSGEAISLGQRQIIAFIRAVLRKPDILILDEATANIDTVTEEILESILKKLPKETARVIIAHRLNTIQNADEIFFVNSGQIIKAGSFDHAVEMLMHNKRGS
jgi:ATP-binding cassette subfamily B protein